MSSLYTVLEDEVEKCKNMLLQIVVYERAW
jgi:hypothetical protein